MKLSDARDRAIVALEKAFQNCQCKVDVSAHPGAITEEEIKRQAAQLPAVLVAVLGRTEQGIRLVAYLLGKPQEAVGDWLGRPQGATCDWLSLLDTLEETFRSLPGEHRETLEVRTECLHSASSSKIGATLWSVSTLWPPLAFGEATNDLPSFLGEVNSYLDGVLRQGLSSTRQASWQYGYDEAKISRLLHEGPLPFVCVHHGQAVIESSSSATYKVPDGATGVQQRERRGLRKWPVWIEFWARSEQEADAACLAVTLTFPKRWIYADYTHALTLNQMGCEYREKKGAYVATVEITMEGGLAKPPKQLPVFQTVQTQGDFQ